MRMMVVAAVAGLTRCAGSSTHPIRPRGVFMRKYKPVELPLRDVPHEYAVQRAICPNCQNEGAFVIGRLGLRLVFRCGDCRVRFHRPSAVARFV